MPDTQNVGLIHAWHAHVYFDAESRPVAAWLRERVTERHPAARIGPWQDEKNGPHAAPNYRIAFTAGDAPLLVPFLALNRRGLSVLLLPETGRPRLDHTAHALWLGPQLPLDVEAIPETAG